MQVQNCVNPEFFAASAFSILKSDRIGHNNCVRTGPLWRGVLATNGSTLRDVGPHRMLPVHLGLDMFPPSRVLPLASAHPIELYSCSIGSTRLMSQRAYRLLERHQKLDDLLRRAQASRFANPFEVARLKKLKLAIKDRLTRLARSPAASR
jgi:uncharacterized protein